MKKLLLTFTLLFSTLMFSTPSYAEWTKVSEGIGDINLGDSFYVDLERIRKNGGYIYFWQLTDHLKPTKFGDLSIKIYKQGDCKLFRFKSLSYHFYKGPMGAGTISESSNVPAENWTYPLPDSVADIILKAVCNY